MTRVLIVKTSSMGDVIHNIPVIADIRRERPTVIVDWMVEEAYVDLVRMTRGVSRVIPVALRRWRKTPRDAAVREQRLAFEADLNAERYDLVIDTQGLLKSAILARRARLAAHGLRVGFSFGLAREPLARLFYDRGYGVDTRLHAIERMRALAASALGYSLENLGLPRFELDVPTVCFDWVADEVADAGYAVLLHATARPEKSWPVERWIELARRCCAAGIVPVLPAGTDAERLAAETIATAARQGSGVAPLVAPALTLPEVAALLANARVVVGVDTGLLHLAAAVDAPVVGLFGATPRWRYAPYWTTRAINLGSFGELGAQPTVDAVVDALARLDVILPALAG